MLVGGYQAQGTALPPPKGEPGLGIEQPSEPEPSDRAGKCRVCLWWVGRGESQGEGLLEVREQ